MRLSLAWKFLIALSIVILIIIPSSSYLFISKSLHVMEQEADQKAKILKDNLRDKGIAMTRNIALNISSAVAGSDFTFLQNVISSTVASDKEIRFAIIVNKEGRALVHSDPLRAMQVLNSPEDQKATLVTDLTISEYPLQGDDIMEFDVPIMLGSERWGTLRMGFTLQYLNAEIQRTVARQKDEMRALTRTSIIIALLSMVSAAILAVIFSRHVVNAIRAIVRVTQQVAQGDFTPRVVIKTGDELETLGQAVNIMTENLDKLTHEVVQKARMESELRTAELVQKKILPKKDPHFPQLEFASYFRSASETGGDWFAYSMQPDGKTLSVIIADVTGHGLPAALLTEAAHSCFTTLNALKYNMSPGEVLHMLNQVLIPQMDHQYGMTAFVSHLELATLHMTFANAGHNMPLIYRGHDGSGSRETFKPLLAKGPRLGDSPNDHFEEKETQLASHNLLFWYTDGLLDCVNPEGECFGKRRVLEVLKENRAQSSPMIRDALISEMMRFTGGMIPPDDVTFIIGKVLE